MFGSMFETAAYHRAGLQWPSAPSACGYTMPAFDAVPPSSRLVGDVPRGHLSQSTTSEYPALGDHGRYAAAGPPFYDGRNAAVREALFGSGRFSADPGGASPAEETRQSSTSAFSPLSLACVGPTSTGAVDAQPPPRLPAVAPYGYNTVATGTDDPYYGSGAPSGIGTSPAFPSHAQSAAGCRQPTTGFRAPALAGLGFNPRRFMNDVIGEYSHSPLTYDGN